ncbi:MAG: Holliday junction branch migration protein RuvA [Butyrivibrio sp.]|nr:Holliday junction branch migration protein RuvA [Butyrivibrio sp.]
MFAYLNGILESVDIDNAIVDVNGFGMNVKISAYTADRMPGIGEAIKIYTYTSVREDAFELYGFLSRDELGIFKQLITVSGIGPKGALSILSVMQPDDLRFAILSSDAKTLAKAPGIGKKTAERIVLELRDKIPNEAIVSGNAVGSMSLNDADSNVSRDDAVQALVALGYNGTEAMKAVRNVVKASGADLETEEILKLALKELF